MDAVIITVGSELTAGRVIDTNTAWIARRLGGLGLRVPLALTAEDSTESIGRTLRFALGRKPGIIVMAGGLGPTHDDLTAQAAAGELGLPLALDEEAAIMVARAIGIPVSDLAARQKKQAMLPEGGVPLEPVGTAPGFLLRIGETWLVVLPGVPFELAAMWDDFLADPAIRDLLKGLDPVERSSLCLFGVGEPEVGDSVDGLLEEMEKGTQGDAGIEVSICSSYREITVDVSYPKASRGEAARLVEALRERLEPYVYSEGKPIEQVIGFKLKRRGATLATGESCTGGMLGEVITAASGSSEYYLGGVIAYHNDVKKTLLGVGRETLERDGAVSESVARQLAAGARSACGADYGIGITGIAGPAGGTPEKPVGLVYICVSSSSGMDDIVTRYHFPGSREDIRRAAVISSLHMLNRMISVNPH